MISSIKEVVNMHEEIFVRCHSWMKNVNSQKPTDPQTSVDYLPHHKEAFRMPLMTTQSLFIFNVGFHLNVSPFSLVIGSSCTPLYCSLKTTFREPFPHLNLKLCQGLASKQGPVECQLLPMDPLQWFSADCQKYFQTSKLGPHIHIES